VRRRANVRRAAIVLAGVLALVGAAACGEGDGGDSADAESSGSERPGGGWEELPGPGAGGVELAEAGGTVVAVTGGELRTLEGDRWLPGEEVPGPGTGSGPLVGTDDEVVIPSAGAAWSPSDESWREVPDSPVVATGAFAAGEELVVVDRAPDEARVVILAAGAAEWRPAEPLAGSVMAAAAVPGGAVVWTYDEPAAEAALSRLDAATGRWSELPPPPFDPPGGGSGLAAEVADGDDRLVATATTGTGSEAAVLDLAGGDWESIDAPPVPGRAVCPSELQGGGGAVVFVAVCSGEPAVLSGGSWDALPAPPFDGTNAAVLVTGDELVVVAADGSAAARRPLP
jgi:hypothetical protein